MVPTCHSVKTNFLCCYVVKIYVPWAHFLVVTPDLFGQILSLERTFAVRSPNLKARSQSGIRVITKSAGSEQPEFTSMDALFGP
jgi:hypothetical protein